MYGGDTVRCNALFWYLVPFNLIRRTHLYVCVLAVRSFDCWLIHCLMCIKCLSAALYISLFCCYTIVFIIIVHAFILSTVPWNRIGSHNLFSFRSLRMGIPSFALLCSALMVRALCSAMHCSVYRRNKCAQCEVKKEHITIQWRQTKGTNTHSHTISFSLADFSSSWCFSFSSRVALFLFEIDFCAYFFSIPFSMHHSLHQGKGMTIAHSMHAELGSGCDLVVERVHCMVERAHFMSEFVV